MINIFISKHHTYTIKPFLKTWPHKAASCIRLVYYQDLHRIQNVTPGLFVFADIDRLTKKQRQLAEMLCQKISDVSGNNLLNNPAKVLSRCQLLTLLWEKGINQYRVHSLSEAEKSMRYPVFIRRANDHYGSLTGLIVNKENYYDQYRRLKKRGEDPEQMIAVEFCDTRDKEGFFRKYSAFRIGDRIIPGHIIFSREWVTKDMPPEPLREEEKQYLEDNPHQNELKKIFDLANIEYGRIDYGLFNGKIQVWEINTNPVIIQKRGKYSKDKIVFKQKLVNEIADAFLWRHTHAEASWKQSKTIDGSFASSVSLSRLQQFARIVCPLKI
ncbi:MAG: hypothetical protein LLG40_14365 [Deltaproteobacteria bacterium]|nr:hypothetical protein [Deltaproteobacteria bacterium]